MNAMTDFPPLDPADNTIDFAALAKQPPLPAVLQDIADISNGKAIVKLNATEAGLSALRADLSGKRYDLTTTKGDKDARADRQRCVTLRTTLEKRRKEMKAPALEFGKLIDGEAKRITDAILALESPIDSAIKADEQRRADEKAERERIEAERIAGLRGQVDALMRGWLDRCNEPDMTAERVGKGIEKFASLQAPADLADVADYWSAQQSITTGRMQTIRADLERVEESARMAAERAELERQQAAARAEQERQAAELARQRAELEAQQAAVRAEAERMAAEAAKNTEGQGNQQVLKADPATADATDRIASANTSPRVGAMGEGQAADAASFGKFVERMAGAIEQVQHTDSIAVVPFDLTPDATDLLGDAATDAPHDTLHDLRALLAHIDAAFTGRFPSHPKPEQSWWATLRTLRNNATV